MKKIFTLSLILVLFGTFSFSQSFSWVRTENVEYEYNPGMITYTTCANPQGGSYFYGIQEHVAFYNESMGDLFLKKFN